VQYKCTDRAIHTYIHAWCGYKITGLNFRFAVNLATASSVWYWLVLSPPFTVTISRSCGKQFGSSLCLKWVVLLFSVGMLLSVNVEQRVNMKCCVKLGKSATETYDLLKKAYGNECLSHTQVFEWFKRFKEGREKIGDDQRPGRPSTSKTDANIEKVGENVQQNRRLSIRAGAELINIDKETVRQILHNNFNMKKVCSKMVQRLLTLEQKETRMNICADTLQNIENDPNILQNVITYV